MYGRDNIRNVPGWNDCPVPVCHGGDPRALTFCCHPLYSLTFSDICGRDEMLRLVGLSTEEFVDIKDRFTDDVRWRDQRVCFNSLAYCCLRRRGCPSGRDEVLRESYGNNPTDAFKEYILRKRVLAIRLLENARNKDIVESYVKKEREELERMGREDILKLLEFLE